MRALISTGPSYGGDDANVNTAGGKALKFYCALRLKLTRTRTENIERLDRMSGKKKNTPFGNVVEARIVKNKVNGTQGHRASLFIRYGFGVDDARSLIECAVANGLVSKGGATYNLGTNSFRGQEALRKYLLANPNEYQTLYVATQKALLDAAPLPVDDEDIDDEDTIGDALDQFGGTSTDAETVTIEE
jgi:hypothetical protein